MLTCHLLPIGAHRLHQEEEEVCAGGRDLDLRGDHHHHGHERHPRRDEPDHCWIRGTLVLFYILSKVLYFVGIGVL